MAIDWHSSWQYIRLWKQGWTIDINQVDGGIWWQRLNECKRHQSASDYCNCHQIPPQAINGSRRPSRPTPPTHTHTYQHHQHSSTLHTTGALPGTPSGHTHKHTHTHCPLVLLLHLLEILFLVLLPLTASSKGYFWQRRVLCMFVDHKNSENTGEMIVYYLDSLKCKW